MFNSNTHTHTHKAWIQALSACAYKYFNTFNTEKCPQCISSIWKMDNILLQYGSVHNTLVQYGKRSTIYKSNMERGPQYISSILRSVHNALVQYGKRSTIYKSNMEKGPQYITSIWIEVHNILVQYRKGITSIRKTLVNTESYKFY